MTKFQHFLTIDADEFQLMERLVTKRGSDYPKDRCVFDKSVAFPLGISMAIQVITTLTPKEDTCWTQGVLFEQERKPDGSELWHEVGCTDVGESFGGDYTVEYDGNEYTVTVISSKSAEELLGVPSKEGEIR